METWLRRCVGTGDLARTAVDAQGMRLLVCGKGTRVHCAVGAVSRRRCLETLPTMGRDRVLAGETRDAE